MQYLTTIERTFSAFHQIPGHPTCSYVHGHRWTVSVTVSGHYEARVGLSVDVPQLTTEFEAIMAELHLKPLNEMLPGVITTPHGLASWIMERLLLNWSVTRVSVSDEPGISAMVVREQV